MAHRAGLQALVGKAQSQLEPGETVTDVTIGALHVPDPRRRDRTRARAMSLLVTDRRVLLFRRTWRSQDVHTLRYDQIQVVDHSRRGKVGELRLTITAQDVVRVSSIPSQDVERIAELIASRCGPRPSAE